MRNMIYRMAGCALLALGWGLSAVSVEAADKAVVLRLGTLAPRGTSYHKSLMVMREKWLQASGGTVRLTIFPDGTQGGESDMVGLMQTGNLDAGLLTAVGLAEIERDVTALQTMPMTFRTLEEVEYLGTRLHAQLEQRLLAKGYVVLFWTDSGWVRFFSKARVEHPDDLRKMKVFTWASDTGGYDVWKAAGFNPIALETAGIAQGLMADTFNAIPMPPFFALAGQMHEQTKFMLELNWAPLVGAAVVRQKSWERIPAETRALLLKTAVEAGQQITASARLESDSAVAAMVKRGLTVQKVSPAVEAEWRAVVNQITDHIRGRIVPAEMYDEAQRLLSEYRTQHGGSSK